ncbi:monocarboxylate transporter 6-like [Amphiura filiformis]|uniref:monocarboxylate transporter 6-like n=1 Tax=Amphiura filiformis TaxID=82378 RepID=UPI003B217651
MAEKDTFKSWIVLAGVTFTVFFTFGCIKSFGVLLPELEEQLSTDTWIVGSCVSLMVAWGFTVGFLLLQDTLMIGVVPQYFDKYYTAAVSIYTCATAFGITIMPIVTQMLLSSYGWRGALLLISGIGLHTIPFGVLLPATSPCDLDKEENEPLMSKPVDSVGMDTSKGSFRIPGLLTNVPYLARVLFPGMVYSYTLNGWMIYIVSLAVSNGSSLHESSVVASCGGVGMMVIRMLMPLLHRSRRITYKHIMHTSSFLGALSLSLTTVFTRPMGMSLMSTLFGISNGALGAEIYIISKDVADEDQYYNVVAVFHLFCGGATILSGFITGK